mmetsp:Transcript_41420/g.132303  ORF Transcript_41420/g.132303 Transcript_41420/m.132303 type:complete len:369 (+) Transcript_41420:173-1279(+)
MLRFKGSQQFRQRVVCACLSNRAIRIDDIRSRDENPGLRDYEANLLRLVERITNGTVVEINETGTSMRFKPGIVTGGGGHVHDCGTARGIGYYLEPLVMLALFGKMPLAITLKGITNSQGDPTVDTWRTVTLPLLRHCGVEDGLELKVVRRGAAPKGGGEVFLKIPLIKHLNPLIMVDEGMIKRVRGVAYSTRVSPQTSNRMVDAARGILNKLLPDVYIFTDHVSGAEAGLSPGFGLSLVAETTSGRLLAAEATAGSRQEGDGEGGEGLLVVPEDVGAHAARCLLEEARRGGVCDSLHQGLLLLLCAVGADEVSKVRLGALTPHAVRTLRHIKAFFNVTFSIKADPDTGTVFLTCVGAAIKNVAKKML